MAGEWLITDRRIEHAIDNQVAELAVVLVSFAEDLGARQCQRGLVVELFVHVLVESHFFSADLPTGKLLTVVYHKTQPGQLAVIMGCSSLSLSKSIVPGMM